MDEWCVCAVFFLSLLSSSLLFSVRPSVRPPVSLSLSLRYTTNRDFLLNSVIIKYRSRDQRLQTTHGTRARHGETRGRQQPLLFRYILVVLESSRLLLFVVVVVVLVFFCVVSCIVSSLSHGKMKFTEVTAVGRRFFVFTYCLHVYLLIKSPRSDWILYHYVRERSKKNKSLWTPAVAGNDTAPVRSLSFPHPSRRWRNNFLSSSFHPSPL